MRLAVFCSILSPWSRQAVLRLVELGNEIHMIDFSNHGQQVGYLHGRSHVLGDDIAYLKEKVAGVHLIHTSIGSRFRYVVHAYQLRKLCQKIDADMLLTLWGGGWAVMSCLSGFRPYAVFVGGGDILRINRWQKLISRWALKKADVVFANGCHFGEKARQFAPGAKIFPLYYGVDPDRFRPFAAPDNPLRIVCTRGFAEVYNNGYLIEGLARLDKDIKNIEIIFTSPGQLLSKTIEHADRILPGDLRSRVIFKNGVTDSEMLTTLQSSHIYVSLSRCDGTSISLLEALSCGLYPVLSDIPQNREWVTPSKGNGLLVPLDEPTALAGALKEAIHANERRQKACEINRNLILERADGRKNMKVLASKLGECINQRRLK